MCAQRSEICQATIAYFSKFLDGFAHFYCYSRNLSWLSLDGLIISWSSAAQASKILSTIALL